MRLIGLLLIGLEEGYSWVGLPRTKVNSLNGWLARVNQKVIVGDRNDSFHQKVIFEGVGELSI